MQSTLPTAFFIMLLQEQSSFVAVPRCRKSALKTSEYRNRLPLLLSVITKCSQGKRNDILRELELLENPNIEVEESTLTILPPHARDFSHELGGISRHSVVHGRGYVYSL